MAGKYLVPEEELIRDNIGEYLSRHESKDLLRMLTCGSVDDGKSTLIGRLLYDSHMIYEDQLAKIADDSKVFGTTDDNFDPALLTDGLKAEREQGITIDVAYRYFSTAQRKFIIADCPGHEQYTRNMATGASNCNLAIILIDARNGVARQTKRHSFICSLLGIKHVVIAVNKMDLVDFSQDVFDSIVADYNGFVARLNFSDIHFIPLSALKGDNVVSPSENLPWYKGTTLLHHIESVNITTDRNLIDVRFPVQYVLRPDLNFRGFAGTLASGVLRVGDPLISLPSRQQSTVKEIFGPDGPLEEAFSPMAVTVTLTNEIDVSRGTMLSSVNNQPHFESTFEAMVVWMHEVCAVEGKQYLVKQTTNLVPSTISKIRYKVDVNTMHRQPNDGNGPARLSLNEIGRCRISLHRSIGFDPYQRNQGTGSFVIVDRLTNTTLAAGMILDRLVPKEESSKPKSQNIQKSTSQVSQKQRQLLLSQKGATIWLTGLSGSGKSTIACKLEERLMKMGQVSTILDGDNVRHGLNRDLGFSPDDRRENIRRISEVAKLFTDAGIITITAFISPYLKDRQSARDVIGENFIEVFVDASVEVCKERDPKGLYAKAMAGEISQFTGVSAPYECPRSPELTVSTPERTVDECVDMIIVTLKDSGVIW